MWLVIDYVFDEQFQQDFIRSKFENFSIGSTGRNSINIADKDSSDEENGIHISANNLGVLISEISLEKYTDLVDTGEINEDKWPDFGIDVFISWKHIHDCYKNYKGEYFDLLDED